MTPCSLVKTYWPGRKCRLQFGCKWDKRETRMFSSTASLIFLYHEDRDSVLYLRNIGKYIYQTVWSHARRRCYDSHPPPWEPNTHIINLITKFSLSIQSDISPHFQRHADSFHLYLRASVGNTVEERWITCHVSHLIRLQATLESFADHLLPMTPSLTHKITRN